MKTSNSAIPLDIRTLPIGQLKPAPYNPRQRLRPTDPAYQKLEASVRAFGLVEPLIWNELTGYIVGGHARLRILKKLGMKEVPVSIVHLDVAQEKALNLVLNNHEAQGRFDTTKLADLLTELEDLPEFELSGFDSTTLRNLRMEPDDDAEDDEPRTGIVTVTLEMDAATFEEIEPAIDALIGEHDLTSHVKKSA